MKELIDINDEIYRHAKDGSEDSNDEWNAMRAIANGTPIPDNATNDDVLKALFDERGYMGIHDRMMHTKWLFAPYQKGGKE